MFIDGFTMHRSSDKEWDGYKAVDGLGIRDVVGLGGMCKDNQEVKRNIKKFFQNLVQL
jgi:hypothetical protein